MSADSMHNDRIALAQCLEGLRRAGVTHVLRSAVAAAAELQKRVENSVETDAASTAQVPAVRAPVASDQRSLDSKSQSNRSVEAVPMPTISSESRQQRIDSLKLLADQVAVCTRCQELAESRTQTVFGVGNPEADIMFIGEAPGADEDRQGEPFVGRAGQLLSDIVKACKLTREEIYICNILRCRPPANRNPTPAEAENCREYLDGQITAIDPDYIVCWGSIAAQNLLDTNSPIGRLRGQFSKYGRAKVLCTYHPSYLLRNPSAKKQVWEDMKLLMRDMGVDL